MEIDACRSPRNTNLRTTIFFVLVMLLNPISIGFLGCGGDSSGSGPGSGLGPDPGNGSGHGEESPVPMGDGALTLPGLDLSMTLMKVSGSVALSMVPGIDTEGECPMLEISTTGADIDFGEGCSPDGSADNLWSGGLSVSMETFPPSFSAFFDALNVAGVGIDGALEGSYGMEGLGIGLDATFDLAMTGLQEGRLSGMLNISADLDGLSIEADVSIDELAHIVISGLELSPADLTSLCPAPSAGDVILQVGDQTTTISFASDGVAVSLPDGENVQLPDVCSAMTGGPVEVNEEPGTEEPGTDEPGDVEPGDVEPGDEEPGDVEPGDDEPGDDEPGDDEPGDDEPGDDEPGDDEPGDDEPGDDEPGDDEPGDDEPGDDEPGDDEPQCEDDAASPNHLPSEAYIVEVGTWLSSDSLVLCSGGQSDYFVVDLDVGAVLAVEASSPDGELFLHIFGPSYNWFNELGEEFSRHELVVETAGEYFIAVQSFDDREISYSLDVYSVPGCGYLPEHSTLDDALEVFVDDSGWVFLTDQVICGIYSGYYKIWSDSDEWLRVDLGFDTSEYDLDLCVYPPNQTYPFACAETTTDDESLGLLTEEAGYYAVEVYWWNPVAGSEAEYDISIGLAANE